MRSAYFILIRVRVDGLEVVGAGMVSEYRSFQVYRGDDAENYTADLIIRNIDITGFDRL